MNARAIVILVSVLVTAVAASIGLSQGWSMNRRAPRAESTELQSQSKETDPSESKSPSDEINQVERPDPSQAESTGAAELEQRIDRLQTALSDHESLLRELARQVEALRAEFEAERRETVNPARQSNGQPRQFVVTTDPPLPVPPTPEEVVVLESQLLSDDAPVEDKLDALRRLRVVNQRSDDVVRHMASLYYATENSDLREDIFRQLDGVTTPELLTPLLQAVANDEAPGVREEAAETLEHYLPNPDVLEWLEYLEANDPSEDVRRQAARSLLAYRQTIR